MSPDSITPELHATPAKEKHNKLDLRSQFKLLDWVRNHEDLARKESDPKLATMASAELELKITPSNIMSTREALDIEKAKPAAPITLEERLSKAEEALQFHLALLGKYGAIIQGNMNSGTLTDFMPGLNEPPIPVSKLATGIRSIEILPGLETPLEA